MTEETKTLMIELAASEKKIAKRFKYLEAVLRFRDYDIKDKVKRIAELHCEIDSLKRKNEELEAELKIKSEIIRRQVVLMEKNRSSFCEME